MRKNIAKTIVSFVLIASSLMICGCKEDKKDKPTTGNFEYFNVQTNVDANYATVFEIPEVVVVDGGRAFAADMKVFNRSNGKEVVVYNNELLIDEVEGYIVRYYADNGKFHETKEMIVSVVDTLAPVVTFENLDDQKIYTVNEKTFAIPVDKVKASDNLSSVKIDYEVFKDGRKVVVSDDVLDVSETGKYDVVFYATDANGNVGEKTLNVYSVDCDDSRYLDFETEWDTDKIYGNNVTSNYLKVSRVSYDELDIEKPTDGGNCAVVMTPIINSMYPRYHVDFGKTMPAGTKVSYSMYFGAHETPQKMFTIEGTDNCMVTTKNYKHNEWITVEAVLTKDTRYMSSFIHLALLDGYDTPAYNYSAGIKVYVDNVSVEKVDDSYYSDFTMVREHIYNDSTSSYLNVDYEQCEIGGYSGMAFKMEVPANNKIIFDADAMAFLKTYASINNYTTITTHVYTVEGKMALNTWSTESLPAKGVWFSQDKTIASLPEFFWSLRENPGTVYMYFEFA